MTNESHLVARLVDLPEVRRELERDNPTAVVGRRAPGPRPGVRVSAVPGTPGHLRLRLRRGLGRWGSRGQGHGSHAVTRPLQRVAGAARSRSNPVARQAEAHGLVALALGGQST